MTPARWLIVAALFALASTGVDEVEIRLDADLVDPIAAYFRRRASRR